MLAQHDKDIIHLDNIDILTVKFMLKPQLTLFEDQFAKLLLPFSCCLITATKLRSICLQSYPNQKLSGTL